MCIHCECWPLTLISVYLLPHFEKWLYLAFILHLSPLAYSVILYMVCAFVLFLIFIINVNYKNLLSWYSPNVVSRFVREQRVNNSQNWLQGRLAVNDLILYVLVTMVEFQWIYYGLFIVFGLLKPTKPNNENLFYICVFQYPRLSRKILMKCSYNICICCPVCTNYSKAWIFCQIQGIPSLGQFCSIHFGNLFLS